MSKIYITGVSGTGKSSLVEELNNRGIVAFDIDSVPDLCHWKSKKTDEIAHYKPGIGRDWIEAHDWLCDVGKLKQLLAKQKGTVVIVGLGSNQDEYLDLFDKIFLLHCSEKIFIHRLTTRDTNQFAKDKSEQELILSWHKEFEDKMIKFGAIPINTEEPLSVVADKVISEIEW